MTSEYMATMRQSLVPSQGTYFIMRAFCFVFSLTVIGINQDQISQSRAKIQCIFKGLERQLFLFISYTYITRIQIVPTSETAH